MSCKSVWWRRSAKRRRGDWLSRGGGAHRENLLAHEKTGGEPRVISHAVGYSDVHFAAVEIRRCVVGQDADFDVPVGAQKAVQSRDQPQAGERRRRVDGQLTGQPAGAQSVHGAGEMLEPPGELGQQLPACFGDLQTSGQAAEKLYVEMGLQGLYLVADGGRRDV